MFSNARRVLSQCNTRLRLLYLLKLFLYFSFVAYFVRVMSTKRTVLIQKIKMGNYVTFSVFPVFSSKPSSSVSVRSIREALRVSCSAKGSPLPIVTWYKNNVSVPVINNITEDEFTSELVIGEFQPADQGTYKCVARHVYINKVESVQEYVSRQCHIIRNDDIITIFVWRGSLEVNLSFLTDLPYGRFPWKRS